jgi:hypothetical protein
VRAARRYRLALLAFPRAARGDHGEELLRVLADVDAERGAASWREATHLVIAGVSLRYAELMSWLRREG